jgi:tetratricopeptide (TPR) repeat protein
MKVKAMVIAGWMALVWLSGPIYGQVERQANDTVLNNRAKYEYYFAEGLRFKSLGNTDQAIALFQQCLDFSQVSGTPYYEIGLIYYDKKDYPTATGYARNAWKRDPQNKWFGLFLIQNLIMQGNFGECADIYRELQKVKPDDEDFVTGEIDMLIHAKQYKEALKRIARVPAKSDMARWAMVSKKDVYFDMNQFDKGAGVLVDWLKKNPDDMEIRGILAEAYATKGKDREAEEQYDILKKENPDNPAVSFSLGQFYLKSGRKAEAIDEFVNGFRSPDVNPAIKIEIIKSFISAQDQQNKLDDHVVRLINVLYEVDKGDPQVDELYANYLYSEEKIDEAEPLYRDLMKKDPGSYGVWQNLLFILNEKQNYKEMLPVADSALNYFPEQGLFYLFKGIAETELRKYPAAIETLNKGLAIPGLNPDIVKQYYLSLAEAYYRNGNPDRAFENYKQMLVLEPDNLLVLNNYSYYLSLEGKELDKALEMSKKCVDKEPDNPTYLDTYAWVLYQAGEVKKALEPMEKAVKLSKDPSGEVLEHYGDILFRNGKTDEAREAWMKARGKEGVSGSIDDKIKSGLK